jgi:DUF4097 and DUF4098 domain-containing protein YvlB
MRSFAVAVLGAVVLTLTACGWGGRNTASDDNVVAEPFTSVRIANDSGSVKIHAGSTARVHRTIHYDSKQPGSTHRVENGTLVIDSCRERNCTIEYELTVPAATRVDGAIDSGSVEVDGVAAVNLKVDSGRASVRHVAGKVNLDSSSGSVEVSDVGQAVVVRSESGRVRVDDVRAAVTVHAESGSVEARGIGGATDLSADSGSVTVGLASPQNVRVQADSGSVNVTVPRADYRVRAQADSGKVNNTIGDRPDAQHQLDLHTASGHINVSYA